MAKFSLRDYCRKNLNGQYRIKDSESDETVVLRGDPAKYTVDGLAEHADTHGIKSVKFPEEAVTGSKTGRATYGSCSGEAARKLVEGWLSADEAAEAAPKAPSANGNRVTQTAGK